MSLGAMTHQHVDLDHAACYRAVRQRDARFDGRFFTGVKTTGVYCRPVCPARTPLFQNVIFFPTAAAAQEAGFRPCLRCRPETAPNLGAWRGTSNTVSRALGLIELGVLDDGDVDALKPAGSGSANGNCGGCFAPISAPRRSPWRRRGGCFWQNS
jgi:methylphosphotriester-DNA--protein-cysteine methyltransferase